MNPDDLSLVSGLLTEQTAPDSLLLSYTHTVAHVSTHIKADTYTHKLMYVCNLMSIKILNIY